MPSAGEPVPGGSSALLLTTIASPDRIPALERLIASVAASAAGAKARVDHHILLQNGLRFDPPPTNSHYAIFPVGTARALSLSAARNQMIARVREQMAQSTIVAFPDDDAWYPPALLDYLLNRFKRDSTLDLWICRYGEQPRAPSRGSEVQAGFAQTLRHASSNTIFVRGSVGAVVGGFVEALGIGTTVPGGEDSEYAIRAFVQSRRVELLGEVCVGHRNANLAIRTHYYVGSLAALAFNLRRVPECRPAIVRKLLVGLYHVLTGHMPAFELLAAWRRAADIARHPP